MTQPNLKAETIFALASAPGRAGVAIMRVSGPESGRVISALTKAALPAPRKAALRNLYDGGGDQIDQALVLRFAGPASFTGEDMAEFHIHGAPIAASALAEALFALGLRQVGPGEFTRRAFENGKLDLTEAEGLADLIDADTDGQRRQALRQMQGGLRDVYEGWRSRILDALAYVEGEIDFPDEGDVPDALARRAGPGLRDLITELERALADAPRGERIRGGVDIAIIGAPNAGKSSIINALARRDAAIVSPTAGTTRDIVEVHLELAGLPVRIADTAGLREAADAVEAEGVKRALARAEHADLRLAVIALDDPDVSVLNRLQDGDMVLYNKTDLADAKRTKEQQKVSRETFLISAETGYGFSALENALTETIKTRFGSSEQAGITRARHRDCVQRAFESAQSGLQNLFFAPELAGADLRNALHAIKELAGETDIEAVLDRVFSSFCIGK